MCSARVSSALPLEPLVCTRQVHFTMMASNITWPCFCWTACQFVAFCLSIFATHSFSISMFNYIYCALSTAHSGLQLHTCIRDQLSRLACCAEGMVDILCYTCVLQNPIALLQAQAVLHSQLPRVHQCACLGCMSHCLVGLPACLLH